ncbi:MAG: hypothetical protein K9W43_07260 [Candidatus Thorarchaeota archaeon]|nr:hypothetical protein [Candidatus Thorarchaeota archaeon]
MDWLAKIIEGKADEFVHAKILKYGKGVHPGPRAFLTLSSKKVGFKADLDFEKVFIRAYANSVPEGQQKIAGVITTYQDRRDEFSKIAMPLEWRVAKGKGATTYKAKIKEVVPSEHLKELLEHDDPTTFFLLTLSPQDGSKPWKITTKTSFPKSPAGGDEGDSEKDPVFSKGALGRTPEVWDFLLKEVLLDVADKIPDKTKKIKIHQDIIIEEIEIPDDPGLSFAEKRRLAKKTGKLIRRVDIDGTTYTSEFPFTA